MVRIAAFSEILKEEIRSLEILDDVEYSCGGVRLHGKGAFIREYKFGTEIKKKWVQHVLRKDDIVFSTLFANKGAFAIADDEVDGIILSEKFPTFRLIDNEVSLDYLRWYFKSCSLSAIAAKQVTGMAAFSLAHLSKKKFLGLSIPIPSIERQKYIVDCCEKAFDHSRLIYEISTRSGNVSSTFLEMFIDSQLTNLPRVPISELGSYQTRNIEIESDQEYKQITVAMKTKGLRLRRICSGIEIRSPGQCTVKEDDILFSRIDLRNGAIGFVPKDLEGGVVTRDFPVFKLNKFDENIKQYFSYIFKSPIFKNQAIGASKGTTGRQKIKRNQFLDIAVPWCDGKAVENIIFTIKLVEKLTDEATKEIKRISDKASLLPQEVSVQLYESEFSKAML